MLILGVCQLQDIVCRVCVALGDIIWMVFLLCSGLMISVTKFLGATQETRKQPGGLMLGPDLVDWITAHGPTSRCDLKYRNLYKKLV